MSESRGSLLDRLIKRLDMMDSNSVQAYILRLSREKGFLETIFNAVNEGILVVDRKLRINYHNRAARELLGLPNDLSRIRISQFIRGVDWRRIIQEDEEEWARISRQEIEILYPTRRVIQFYLVPNGGDAKGLATVILNDVTEARSRTLEELETEKNSVVSMLAGSVAHEIGNPLNSLYLHLQLLQRQFKAGKPDMRDSSRLLETAKNEVERLDNIIHQFLNAIRPGKPRMNPVDVTEVAVGALTFMKQEIQDRGIEVKCSWPERVPTVPGDANQLRQAFYNILKNSLQAMPYGGAIDIECGFDSEMVQMIFSDSGPGIAAENINTVFEPYNSTKKEGSGLGLMIIERIVREHGADLAVESEIGKGTRFIIRFYRHGKRFRMLPEVRDEHDYIETQKRGEQ